MNMLQSILTRLKPSHRDALLWFHERRGQEVKWPERLADGTFIVNKAKGIHKPEGFEYAVSVRQSLKSPYYDRAPLENDDGFWTYQYFQEGLDPAKRNSQST